MKKLIEKILQILVIILIWTNLLVLTTTAQDVTNNLDYTRAICVEGVGCMYTHLRDEALDELFPDKERLTGIDQSLVGNWTLEYEITNECDDESDSKTYTDTLPIRIVSEEGTDQILLVSGFDPYVEYAIFRKISEGMYVGEEDFADSSTSGWSTYFLMKVDDDLLRGISFSSSHNASFDVYCYSSSLITGVPR